jgi:integrase
MRLLFPDDNVMKEQGYAQVAHIPFLLGDDGAYLDEANRYLRERALLEWLPEEAFDLAETRSSYRSGRTLSYPTTASLRAIGERLKNFLSWCIREKLDWRVAEYTQHVVNGYQVAMSDGKWSADGRSLGGATINQRAAEATLFLAWSVQTGLRLIGAPPFKVPRHRGRQQRVAGTSSCRNSTIPESRAGRVHEVPQLFTLPSSEEVAVWLSRVYTMRGKVKGLCCELILETGIRLQECVQWRVDTLPLDRDNWNVRGGVVLVLVQAGTKGRRARPSDINGPPRWVSIPLPLAEKLHGYRQEERVSQHARWIRAAKTSEERAHRKRKGPPIRLFLGEASNCPFTDRMLRRIWSETPGCPSGWSPHKGRHYFACQKLIEITINKAKAAGREIGQLNSDWLTGSLVNDISLVIRPMLGHVSDETTNRYLDWLRTWFETQTDQGSLRWQDYLEKE